MRARLAILILFVLAWTIPAHAFLLRFAGGVPVAPSQTIASITPSSASFTAAVPNGVVATLTVTMSPASPTFTGAGGGVSLTGANTGGFHLASCSGNTCLLEQASSGGTAAGIYTDVSAVAAQTGVSTFTQPLTLTGSTPPAGITLVQKPAPTACGTASSCAVSMTGLVAGHVVTIGATWCADGPACDEQNSPISSVTDTSGNTCTGAPYQGADPEAKIFTCPVVNAGSDTFTVNWAATAFVTVVYPREWSGVSVGTPLDASNTAGTLGYPAASPASVGTTSTVAGDLIYSLAYFAGTPTVAPGQTALAADGYDEYQTVGAAGAYTNTWTFSSTVNWGAAVVALKPVVITSIALSANTFTAGEPSGTVIGSVATALNPTSPVFSGTDSIVSTGYDHTGTTACTSTNAADFQMVNVSGTWTLELNATLGAGSYPGVCIASTQAGSATFVQAFTITGVTQTLSLPTLSNNTYTPGVANGVVGTVTAVVSPTSPPVSASLSITNGGGAGGFQLLSCSGATCTLAENAAGTTGIGPYSDFNIVATGSYPNSPQSITPTVVAPPANTMAIADASGLGATNYPEQFGRPFYPGGMPATPVGAGTGTVSGTTLTLSAGASGFAAGQVLVGADVPNSTQIVSGSGLVWTISTPLTISSATAFSGNIAACPQVTYAGTQIPTQTDVLNRYPDGSIKFAEISVVLPSIPAAAKLPTTAAGSGTTLTFSSVPAWMADGMSVIDADNPTDLAPGTTVVSFTSTTVTLSSSAASVGSGNYIQFGTQTLSIAPVTAGSYSGDHITATAGNCANSAPLSVANMLANYNFDSQITYSGGVSPSGSDIVSARAMLTDAATCSSVDPMSSLAECRLFYYGGVADTIMLGGDAETSTCPGGAADGASKWDIGFGNNYCPIRPRFYATFWPGTNQVWIRFVSDTGMYNAYQDSKYVATLTGGQTSPATEYGPADLTATLNGTGEGITGLTAGATVISTYTGNMALIGTPSSALISGDWYIVADSNTGELFQGTWTSGNLAIFLRGLNGYGPDAITSGDTLVFSGTPESNANALEQWAGTDWTRTFWLGGMPNNEINIDNNLPYLEWTHYVPNYDATVKIPESVIAGPAGGACAVQPATWGHQYGYNGWYSQCPQGIYSGAWDGGVYAQDMGTYGARPEIGINPTWASEWLDTGDWRLRTATDFQADSFSSWAFHLIQTSPSAKILRYDTPGTGLGLPATTQGNQGIFTGYGEFPYYSDSNGYSTSVPTLTGAFNNKNPWAEMTLSHAPEPYYVPYVVGGDPFYLREMGEWTTYISAQDYIPGSGPSTAENSGPPDANGEYTYNGTLAHLGESRYAAWDFRNRAVTANAWPDGDAQQDYYISLANDSLASLAGAYQIGTSSPYYGTKMYDWASTLSSGPSYFCSSAGNNAESPIGDPGCSFGANMQPVGDCQTQGASGDEMFFTEYFLDDAGLAAEMGFPDTLSQWVGRVPLGFINSGYPELFNALSQGWNVTDNSNAYFPTMAAVINNFTSSPNGTSYLTNSPPYTGACSNGRSVPTQWALSLEPSDGFASWAMPGLAMQVDQDASGASTAWSWFNPNFNQILISAGAFGGPNAPDGGWAKDNQWDIVPRSVGDTAPLWSFDPTIQ